MRQVLALAACVLMMGQASSTQTPQPSSSGDYQFRADTGMLLFHVRPDRTQDFEQIVDRIARGLEITVSQVRREQGAGWRVYRSSDTHDAAVYVMVFEPVLREVDYDPVKMLTELAPDDADVLYERLRAAVIRVERLDLERMR